MLVIRLLRAGKKNQPFFQIVVTEKKNPPKGGRFTERIGFYNPMTKEKNINSERVQYWLSKGAQPSDTVHNFLVDAKIIQASKIAKHKKSKKEQKTEEPKPETKPEEPKVEEPKVEEPKVEEPKVEPKPEESVPIPSVTS
ncbi:MAG: 30S ribosomal protein S16 [Patescibacteria group bacterium]